MEKKCSQSWKHSFVVARVGGIVTFYEFGQFLHTTFDTGFRTGQLETSVLSKDYNFLVSSFYFWGNFRSLLILSFSMDCWALKNIHIQLRWSKSQHIEYWKA